MARAMCESCGMPLKDETKGTNADGAKSDQYCMHCFDDGKFTAPDATAAEMRELSIKGMTEGRWPKWLATFMTKNIDKLPRWQKADTSVP